MRNVGSSTAAAAAEAHNQIPQKKRIESAKLDAVHMPLGCYRLKK
jgi:hypothetical protein